MIINIKKKFNPRIKARIRKNKQIIGKNIDNFFDWIKGAELVELNECNTEEDPVRPELDNVFRRSYGRKIFGVKYKNEIHAVMCFAYTNKIPKNVEELDKEWRANIGAGPYKPRENKTITVLKNTPVIDGSCRSSNLLVISLGTMFLIYMAAINGLALFDRK